MQFLAALFRRGIIVVSHTVAAVKPSCTLMITRQRFLGSAIDWYVGIAEFDGIQSIARRLLDVYVPRNRGDRHHADIRRSKRHDKRDRVVRSDVRIDQKRSHERV